MTLVDEISDEFYRTVTDRDARSVLIAISLDFWNDYLTVPHYAARNHLTVEQAEALLALARSVRESPHPQS